MWGLSPLLMEIPSWFHLSFFRNSQVPVWDEIHQLYEALLLSSVLSRFLPLPGSVRLLGYRNQVRFLFYKMHKVDSWQLKHWYSSGSMKQQKLWCYQLGFFLSNWRQRPNWRRFHFSLIPYHHWKIILLHGLLFPTHLYYLQCLTNYLDDVANGYKIFTFWHVL